MLHLPAGLTIDPVAIDRLERQLAAAPDSVIGVAAPVAELPPGSSTRVHAEWCSLRPLDDATDGGPVGSDGVEVTGAVLVRPGVEATLGPDTVHVRAGTLRTDPGAVVHRRLVDPNDADADAEGRSPFPWRPLVLFLASDDPTAPRDLDALEPLLEGLIDADVEPRLAARGLLPAARRHRPCAPSAATVERLAPDVIVALDRSALEQAPGWCTRRGTVLVDMTAPTVSGADGIELVSWQIDRHPTRVRARTSSTIAADVLARLVNRLAAGPQPAPPDDTRIADVEQRGPDSDESTSAVAVGLGSARERPPARTVVAVGADPTDAVLPPVLAGLVDRFAVAGHDVRRVDTDATTTAIDADLVLLPPRALDASRSLLAERGRAGRPTVLVVEAVGPLDDADEGAGLGDLGDLGGLAALAAVAADAGAVDRLRRRGVATQLVPVMTPIAHQDAIRAAGEGRVESSGGTIGWTIAAPTDAAVDDPVTHAVAAGLVEMLDDRPDLVVEVVAGPLAVPGALADHPQVHATRGRPDAGEQARWTAHVLTAAGEGWATADVVTPLLEAAHAGVPTMVPTGLSRAVGGLADPRLVVDEPTRPEAWTGPLDLLLDGRDRPSRSSRAREVAHALERPEATDLVIVRLLGWLDREASG